MAKPMGPTRCSRQAVQAQVRATLPVFWGMRGSTRTMFKVGLCSMFPSLSLYGSNFRHGGQPGQQRLEPDPEAGVGGAGGVLDGLGHKAGGRVGGGAEDVAPPQRARHVGPEQIAGARDTASVV